MDFESSVAPGFINSSEFKHFSPIKIPVVDCNQHLPERGLCAELRIENSLGKLAIVEVMEFDLEYPEYSPNSDRLRQVENK